LGIDITVESTDLIQPTIDISQLHLDVVAHGDVVNNGRALFIRVHDVQSISDLININQTGYGDTEYTDFIVQSLDLSGDILVSLQNRPVEDFPLSVQIPVSGDIIVHHLNQNFTESDGENGISLHGFIQVLVDSDGQVHLDEYNPSYIVASDVGHTQNIEIICSVVQLGNEFEEPDTNFCLESPFYGIGNSVSGFITKDVINNNFISLLNRISSAEKLKSYIGLDGLINDILLHETEGLLQKDDYGDLVFHQEILHDGNDPEHWIALIHNYIDQYETYVQEHNMSFINNIKILVDDLYYDLENSDALQHAHEDAQKIVIRFFHEVLKKLYVLMNHKH
jgi:hypothetical protein